MNEQVETSYNTTTSTNQGFNNAPSLKIRLDTTDLRENVEMYLKGEEIVRFKDDQGNIFESRKPTGNAKANSKGIHAILNYVSLIINPQAVQGNFPSESKGVSQMYDAYVYEVNIDLLEMIMTHLYEWEMSEDDVNEIVNAIMKIVMAYMTRPIDNKERESYETTIRHAESNRDVVTQGKPKLLS